MTCPTPTTVKELQCFLGFTNFYQQFIRSFSSVTTPLTALLKKVPKCLQWNPEAEKSFTLLKTAFLSSPILKCPDSMKPFIVEVDAFESGVRAVLSQHFGKKPKLHPVVFFSKKLTPWTVTTT